MCYNFTLSNVTGAVIQERMPLLRQRGLVALVDTGAECTVICEKLLKGESPEVQLIEKPKCDTFGATAENKGHNKPSSFSVVRAEKSTSLWNCPSESDQKQLKSNIKLSEKTEKPFVFIGSANNGFTHPCILTQFKLNESYCKQITSPRTFNMEHLETRKRFVQTLNGTREISQVSAKSPYTIKVFGESLNSVFLVPGSFVLKAHDQEIHAILGCDWISAQGSVEISYDAEKGIVVKKGRKNYLVGASCESLKQKSKIENHQGKLKSGEKALLGIKLPCNKEKLLPGVIDYLRFHRRYPFQVNANY